MMSSLEPRIRKVQLFWVVVPVRFCRSTKERLIKVCGKFIRLRIKIDLTKPQRRDIMASMGGIWIVIKYKRLPNFCYTFGKLGHVDLDCAREESKQC